MVQSISFYMFIIPHRSGIEAKKSCWEIYVMCVCADSRPALTITHINKTPIRTTGHRITDHPFPQRLLLGAWKHYRIVHLDGRLKIESRIRCHHTVKVNVDRDCNDETNNFHNDLILLIRLKYSLTNIYTVRYYINVM